MDVLVLSGGGSKGAYELGVIERLAEAGYSYDGFTGVSVGALNSSVLSMYNREDFKEGVAQLAELWEGLTTRKVRKPWFPFGILQSPWEPSVYNSSPLWKMTKEVLDAKKIQSSDVKLGVGCVRLEDGKYSAFTDQDPEVIKAVLASSSFPVALKPIKFDTRSGTWSDGGLRNTTPIKSAIDMGATHLDIVLTFPEAFPHSNTKEWKTPAIALQALRIMLHEVVENDLAMLATINELVELGRRENNRYITYRVMRPEVKLINNSLNFDFKETDRMRKIGLSQYRNVLTPHLAPGR